MRRCSFNELKCVCKMFHINTNFFCGFNFLFPFEIFLCDFGEFFLLDICIFYHICCYTFYGIVSHLIMKYHLYISFQISIFRKPKQYYYVQYYPQYYTINYDTFVTYAIILTKELWECLCQKYIIN